MNDDLISRSALIDRLAFKRMGSMQRNTYPCLESAIAQVKKAPAVDAVIPVRCKDCKHYWKNLENDTYCSSVNGLTDPEEDDFCSYGERRADE